jgi:hypothetical protein
MMFDDSQINSGDDYADLLINDLKLYNEEMKMDLELFKYWEIEIRNLCNIRYLKYIEGELEYYLLTDKDIMCTYEEASLKMTGDIIGSLVDKGVVSMGINEDGEVVYRAKDLDKF